MTTNRKEFFSRKELAATFGVTSMCIRNWERSGKLTPIKLGKLTVRYARHNVEAMIAAASAGSSDGAPQA
jgi:hypothetical protein